MALSEAGFGLNPSLGRCADNVIIPFDPTTLLSRFHHCFRSSFWLHNRHSRLLGGSPVESLQSYFIHTQFHWSSGPPVCFPSWATRVQSPGGCICEIGILLLALSHCNLCNSATFLIGWECCSKRNNQILIKQLCKYLCIYRFISMSLYLYISVKAHIMNLNVCI